MNIEIRDIPVRNRSKWGEILEQLESNRGKALFISCNGDAEKVRASAITSLGGRTSFALHTSVRDGGIYLWLGKER